MKQNFQEEQHMPVLLHMLARIYEFLFESAIICKLENVVI